MSDELLMMEGERLFELDEERAMHDKIRVNVEELPINSSSFLRSKDQSTILRKCEAETVLRLLHLI
ncbi:hypothetical protein PRIPAC_81141, partial [Pristionchus pacificus]|uniref:Uncharacterized protein n=1 Tax=Pristionchus pacificus TaxID=54126 RepID=A0A2A6BHC1_PRIPA